MVRVELYHHPQQQQPVLCRTQSMANKIRMLLLLHKLRSFKSSFILRSSFFYSCRTECQPLDRVLSSSLPGIKSISFILAAKASSRVFLIPEGMTKEHPRRSRRRMKEGCRSKVAASVSHLVKPMNRRMSLPPFSLVHLREGVSFLSGTFTE